MGDCYRGQMNMEKAVFWWDQILEHEPENQSLWTRVGDALVSLGRLDEAVHHYQSSLDNGHDLYAVLGLARVAHRQGDTIKAVDLCEHALSIDTDNPRALETLLTIYDNTGDTEKAQAVRARLRN